MTPHSSESAAIIRRLLGQVRRRRRWGRVARAVCAGLLTGAVIRMALTAASWFGDWRPTLGMLAGTWLFGPLAGAALALARRGSWRDAAAAIDRHGTLNDRTITALELLSRPPTPLAELQIAETAARLIGIEAAAVVRWRMPKLLPWAAAACYLSVWLPVCPKVGSSLHAVASRVEPAAGRAQPRRSARKPRHRVSQSQPEAARGQTVDPWRSAPRSSPTEQSRRRVTTKSANSVGEPSGGRPATALKRPARTDALTIVAAELDFDGFFGDAERGTRAGSAPGAIATRDKDRTITVRSHKRTVGNLGGESSVSASPPSDEIGNSPATNAILPPTVDSTDLSSTTEQQPTGAPSSLSPPTDGDPSGEARNAADELPEPTRRAANPSTTDPTQQSAIGPQQRQNESSPSTSQPKASASASSQSAQSAEGRSNLTYDGKKQRDMKPAKKPPADRSSTSKPGPSQGRGLGLPAAAGGYSGPRGNQSSESHSNGTGGRGGPGGKGGTGPAGGGRLPKQTGAPRPATDEGFLQSDRPTDLYQLAEPHDDAQARHSSQLWPAESGPFARPSETDAGGPANDEAETGAVRRDGSSPPGNSPFDAPPQTTRLRRDPQPASHQRQPASGTDESLPLTGARSAGGPVRIEAWGASKAYQPARRPWQAIDYDARPVNESPPLNEAIPPEQRATVRRYFEAIHGSRVDNAAAEER